MVKTVAILLVALSLNAAAGVLITPQEALALTFGKESETIKKSILLSRDQAAVVSKRANAKLSTKLYRAFIVRRGEKIVGYGVLLNETVRSKNAAALHMTDADGVIKAIEIVAFNEPPEYMPSGKWLEQFKTKSASDPLRVGKDIPTITGATMSARNISDGARVALAIVSTVLQPR